MGDLSVGDWDFAEYPDYPITTLKQYREYKEKPSTRFIPSFTGLNLIGSSKMSRLEPFIFKGLIGIKIIF